MIAAGIGAAATGVAIAEQPSAPAAPTDTASKEAASANAAAMAQAEALTKRRGLASTILTSPTGTGSANVAKATLG